MRSRQAVAGQAAAAGAERVGLDDVGAGGDVGAVDGAHQVGVRRVQLGQRAIQRDAAGVQHGAHRAVAHQHLAGEPVAHVDVARGIACARSSILHVWVVIRKPRRGSGSPCGIFAELPAKRIALALLLSLTRDGGQVAHG